MAGARRYRLAGYDPAVCGSLLLSPSGGFVLYGISRGGWPALEVLDLATGARSVFESHACSPAWGRDNEIAYVHYESFHVNSGRYSGWIVVQHGLNGSRREWTGDGSWGNLIWARDDLLASESDLASPELVIVYGPGEQRAVGGHHREPGPLYSVVALNPAGTEAMLDTQRLGRAGSQDSEDLATLLRIRDDAVLSTAMVDSDEFRNSDLVALAPDGDWSGDEVLTTDGIFEGGSSHPPATLVILTVHDSRVQLQSVRPIAEHGSLPMAQSLAAAHQAHFLDRSRRSIALWFEALGQSEYLDCDTVAGSCISGPNFGEVEANYGTFLANPSRP